MTERGSTRHTNAKHNNLSHDKIVPSTSKVKTKSAEKILHPLYLKQFVEKGITKLINDGFYPEEIVNELNQYTVGNLDKINHTYSFIKPAISSFNGDVDKFYPLFYKCVSDADNLFEGSISTPKTESNHPSLKLSSLDRSLQKRKNEGSYTILGQTVQKLWKF